MRKVVGVWWQVGGRWQVQLGEGSVELRGRSEWVSLKYTERAGGERGRTKWSGIVWLKVRLLMM